MKRKALSLILLSFLIVGCGGNNQQNEENQQTVTKYKVTFANTSMSSVEVNQGESLQKPTDPQKPNYLFVGWYLDASFTQEAHFPMVITQDTTIYANFYSYQEAFAKARNNTIGNTVPGYEYDYTLHMSVGYMGLTLNGNTTRNTKYNSKQTDVTFYDAHVNSGSLFYDGSKYQIKRGRELHTVTLNERDEINNYKIEDVGDDYKYDSSSFAKAVFEYDDSKLKEITPTSTPNEYQLKTTFTFSQGVALVSNYVNHPMVEKLIGEVPETSGTTGMYVTFSGDKLNTYRYEMNVNVTDIQFTFTYELGFKNVGVAPTINPKTFADTYVTNSDVSIAKTEINGYLNSFKALEHSSYDFKVKTAVDYAKKNAINATINGFTKRKVSRNTVYYLNDYEVDTDHKNADLYKSQGLGDCHGARVKLSTGEVHDLKKKVLGGYSDIATISHNSVDDYYLFDVLGMIDTVSFIQKVTKSGKTTYFIGTETSGAANILNAFNNALRLNPLGECSVDVNAFGLFNESLVTIKKFEFSIVVENGALSEISLTMNGKFKTSFPN